MVMKIIGSVIMTVLLCTYGKAQETVIFSDGTDQTYYDQGIVDVANLGASLFEHTHPPGLPQYNDKVPCSAVAFRGSSSLRFSYTSSPAGNWKASIFRTGWTTADITGMDSLAFYVFSDAEVPASALPHIGLRAMNISGSGEVSSALYSLSDNNGNVPAATWTRISFPLSTVFTDPVNAQLNYSAVKAVIFNQSEANNTSRNILVDEITVYKNLVTIPPVTDLVTTGYDSHAELSWKQPLPGLSYKIYASFDDGVSYQSRGEVTDTVFLDFVPLQERNSTVHYRVVTVTQGRESAPVDALATLRDFSDDELLDLYQRYSFRFFWEGAHKPSGMAQERSNGDGNTVASGATGMGLMAMIAAFEREYEPREEIKDRIISILSFLETCDRHHGAWSHWYYGDTGHTKPFTPDDDGGDLVETSYVAQALIALKNYFSDNDPKSLTIRGKSDNLWRGIDWNWYRQSGQNVLYWHWSPTIGFTKNMKVTGWSECLVTYIMAASSPTHGVPAVVYSEGWARNGAIVNNRTYYSFPVKLSPDWGGPLFWLHYSHLGIDPHDLRDSYADYWTEHVNTVKIHHAYAVNNPAGWEGYSDKCWGLTASDDPYGYTAHQPISNDNGTISPTAALSSMPYAPEEAIKALKYFYRERGSDLFGKFGPYDAFNDDLDWVRKAYIGIDQGPIMVMIENYRTGLLWKNVMCDPDVQAGLTKLGFQFRVTSGLDIKENDCRIKIFPNPSRGEVMLTGLEHFGKEVIVTLFTCDGKPVRLVRMENTEMLLNLDFSSLEPGIYILRITDGIKTGHSKLLIIR